MAELPLSRGVDYTQEYIKVTTSSTICVRRVIYSVPSRLIGERLNVRLYDDRIECYVGSEWVETLKRVHVKGHERGRSINYKHLITSLSRKPMAFFHAELRDDILPNNHWRKLWQECCQKLAPRQGCYLMVGALRLAAEGDEAQVAEVLQVDPNRVRNHFKRYRQGGIKALGHIAFRGRECALDEEQLAILDAHLQTHLYRRPSWAATSFSYGGYIRLRDSSRSAPKPWIWYASKPDSS